MPERPHHLSDLERRAYRAMVRQHMTSFPDSTMDGVYLNEMARAVVDALTTGSASGRRLRIEHRRLPDPGSTPDKIRQLARTIEGTFHTMPNGWVAADDQLGTAYE